MRYKVVYREPTVSTLTKLLALDVEGTIITQYDESKILPDQRCPAIIDPQLKDLINKFHQLKFLIVLATGTQGGNLDYYKEQFECVGFSVDCYLPPNHDNNDSKSDKLKKYQNEWGVRAHDIYFFDDAQANVRNARNAGYEHSYLVTRKNTLVKQLSQLYKMHALPLSTISEEIGHIAEFKKLVDGLIARKPLIEKRIAEDSFLQDKEKNQLKLEVINVIENAYNQGKTMVELQDLITQNEELLRQSTSRLPCFFRASVTTSKILETCPINNLRLG